MWQLLIRNPQNVTTGPVAPGFDVGGNPYILVYWTALVFEIPSHPFRQKLQEMPYTVLIRARSSRALEKYGLARTMSPCKVCYEALGVEVPSGRVLLRRQPTLEY